MEELDDTIQKLKDRGVESVQSDNLIDTLWSVGLPEKFQRAISSDLQRMNQSLMRAQLPTGRSLGGYAHVCLSPTETAIRNQGTTNEDKDASMWLTCNPNLQLSNNDFSISVAVRLGMSVIGSRRYCLCGDELSPSGEHAMHCMVIHSNRFKQSIHKSMKKTLTTFMRQAEAELKGKVMEGEPQYLNYFIPVE